MTSAVQERGLVSVIMPYYETEPAFLREAIESVQQQTYPHWELIVVDDGSTVPVTEIAAGLPAVGSARVRLAAHAGRANKGISASRNLGIGMARGEFIAFLDADDVWDDTQLAEQVELLRRERRAAMVYGNTVYWNSWQPAHDGECGAAAGRDAHDFMYNLVIETPQLLEPPELLRLILKRRTISPCMTSLLVRRQVFLDGVAFDEAFPRHYEDQVFLAQVFARFPVYVIDRRWGRYRQHAASVTGDGDDSSIALAWRLRYLHWLARYLRTSDLEGTPMWRSVQAELWVRQNRVANFGWSVLRNCTRGSLKALGVIRGSLKSVLRP